jgi:hypothetical protein
MWFTVQYWTYNPAAALNPITDPFPENKHPNCSTALAHTDDCAITNIWEIRQPLPLISTQPSTTTSEEYSRRQTFSFPDNRYHGSTPTDPCRQKTSSSQSTADMQTCRDLDTKLFSEWQPQCSVGATPNPRGSPTKVSSVRSMNYAMVMQVTRISLFLYNEGLENSTRICFLSCSCSLPRFRLSAKHIHGALAASNQWTENGDNRNRISKILSSKLRWFGILSVSGKFGHIIHD